MSVIPEKLRQAYHNDLTDVPLLIDAAEELDRLYAKVIKLEDQIKLLENKAEDIRRYEDLIHRAAELLGPSMVELEKAKAEIERLKQEDATSWRPADANAEIRKLKTEVERLEEQCRGLAQAALNNGQDLLLKEAEVERLNERIYKTESNRDDWKERAKELEVQVKRLLAKEGARISDALRSGRISEAMKSEPRRDANGDPIPWPMDADYFMAFDPADPDRPTD